MKQTKRIILLFMCVCFAYTARTQDFSDEQNKLHKTVPVSSLNWHAMRIDLNNPSDLPVYIPKSNPYKRGDGRWYPIKGEVYKTDETTPAGHIYHEINDEGFLDCEIIVAVPGGGLYDSTYSVLNRTPYTKGKDLIDTTYNYDKNPDGSYTPALKRVHSYHYLDHFEGDSCFYELILYQWNASTNQWDNWGREKFGYHNITTKFLNRHTAHSGSGNNWFLTYSFYDSVSENSNNTVDTVYFIRYIRNNAYTSKVAITYDNPEAGYTQRKVFANNNGQWVTDMFYYDIEWTEWNGFTYSSVIFLGPEPETPYKISKVKSYKIQDPNNDIDYYYEKWWDIGTTKDNTDTTYRFFDGVRYPVGTTTYRYNEYGDLIEWRSTSFTFPDANGNQTETVSNYLYPHVYDEIYGLIEKKTYIGNTFYDGRKYTDFAYYVSVPEIESLSKQALNISPNPATGNVSISASETIKELQIFNSNGKLVNKQAVANEKITFDVTILTQGIYLVRAILENNDTQTGKLIVE